MPNAAHFSPWSAYLQKNSLPSHFAHFKLMSPMNIKLPTALVALACATIIPSQHAMAASAKDYIKEVVADCEELDGDQVAWKATDNQSSATAEPGIGLDKSKGLHIKAARAGNIGIKPAAMIGHPPLDVSLADGYMFWVKAVEGGGFFLEFKVQGAEKQRYILGKGVLAMDAGGNFLEPKEYLSIPRTQSLSAWIKLPTDFEGWIIIPSTVSVDGQNTGWKCSSPEAIGQPIPPISSFLVVIGDTGEFYLDHFSLYQAKR